MRFHLLPFWKYSDLVKKLEVLILQSSGIKPLQKSVLSKKSLSNLKLCGNMMEIFGISMLSFMY